MASSTDWTHFKEITEIINWLNTNIRQIASSIDRLKSMKETFLDDAEFKAGLKEIVDVSHDTTMESLVDDYQRFQVLRNWLVENKYI